MVKYSFPLNLPLLPHSLPFVLRFPSLSPPPPLTLLFPSPFPSQSAPLLSSFLLSLPRTSFAKHVTSRRRFRWGNAQSLTQNSNKIGQTTRKKKKRKKKEMPLIMEEKGERKKNNTYRDPCHSNILFFAFLFGS